MSNKEQTRFIFGFRWTPSPNARKDATQYTAVILILGIVAAILTFVSAASAQNNTSSKFSQTSDSTYTYSLPAAPTDRSISNQEKPIFTSASETTQNALNVQKTFKAPDNQNAALIGTFILRLLPEEIRDRTSCRYSEADNLIIMSGPEEAIRLSENLLNNFSSTLFNAFLTSGEFVSVAGVSRNRPIPTVEGTPASSVGKNYYDPNRNDYVRVAYDPQGAIVPERQEYAVAFGSGNNAVQQNSEQLGTIVENSNRPTFESVMRQSADPQQAAINSSEDSILDVATYRCNPAYCDRVAQLVEKQFAMNPEIAFSVDRQLGTIVVHTNRKNQREVGNYLAQLQVYPAKPSAYEADLRIARGDVVPIDGTNAETTNLMRSLNQVVKPQASTPQSSNYASTIDDVYTPQNRKAEELKDSLLKLFGERLERLQQNNTAPFSQRQIVTYRFVKRQSTTKVAISEPVRICDVSVDALHNIISLQGDADLCSQMLVLLRAMDQPPLRNGNVRRFIPLHNCNPAKLQQIFEYDTKKTANANRSRINSLTMWKIANDFCSTNLPQLSSFATETPVQDRLVNIVEELVTPTTRDSSAYSINLSNEYPQKSYGQDDVSGDPLKRKKSFEIRQVAYQEGDLGALGSGLGSSDFDSFRDGRSGLGVVQDFTPTVLQDLDVVIVDNATDAEFERIKQMIEQIEELAKIAEIQTEIYNLKHVDCAMLHGVLSTLYTEMFTTKQGRVVFYALQNPNAILVAGWGQAFADMKSMIQLFDQPVADGTGTYRVVRLKYASVDEIADLLTTTFTTPQTSGTGGFAPRIRVFADVRTNSLVIQAAPNDWNEIQKILLELDVNKADTKLVTRIFPLKNSLAENIRTTIMNAILPAKQGTLDTSAAKFPVLQLLSVDDDGRRLVESGVMMDVDVSADVFHNQLVVSAPEDCMEFMERLIELLDVAPKKAQIRFFQVRHGDATSIVQTLQSLLATTDNNLSAPTLPQAEAEETFVPVRFAVDSRTNVVIAAAAPKELAIIDALIVALDVKDTAEREEVVIQLRNIQALVVAEAIDSYLSQKQTLETASEVLSNYQLYESQIIVIPESISNSIIVSASPEEMKKILEMIRTFDQDPPQVQIKVLIAEVTLSNTEEFGIETGLQNSTSFDRSVIHSTSQTGTPGFDIIGSSGPGKNITAGVDPTEIAGQVLNNFGMGTTSSLGYGGFVLSASSRSIAATLRALREKNKLQVLSCPQVTAMDNQQAFILVGQRVPRINGTTTTNYGVQMNTTDTPVGLILLVTPRVTKDGKVVMEIGAEKSSLGNDSDATPIYSQDGQVIKSRSIDTIQTMTAISAHDGETVMLGGLLTSTKEKISRGVPYLSDVPVLGWLFRYDQETVQRKELLIVMTPRIMRNSADFAEVMQREMGKTHVDLDEAMSLNGNMGLYNPCSDQGYQPKKTNRLLNDLVNIDKMSDLEDSPSYSPNNDYRPREIQESDDERYQQRVPSLTSPSATGSTRDSLSDAVTKRRYTGKPAESLTIPKRTDESMSHSNEEFFIDDRFTSNTASPNASSEPRVALREADRISGASLVQPESKNKKLEIVGLRSDVNPAATEQASDLRSSKNQSEPINVPRQSLGISQYRKNMNVDSGKSASEKYDVPQAFHSEGITAEAYNPEAIAIRGQSLSTDKSSGWNSRFTNAVPYHEAKESSRFKLFHWSKN